MDHYLVGCQLLKLNHYDKALKHFKLIPENPSALNLSGVIYNKNLKDPVLALECFNKAVKAGNKYAYINLGDYYFSQNKISNAIYFYKFADNDISNVKIGYIQYKHSRYDQAYYHFTRAVNQGSIIALANIAQGFIENNFQPVKPYYICYYLIRFLNEMPEEINDSKIDIIKKNFTQLPQEHRDQLISIFHLRGQIWCQDILNLPQLPKEPEHPEDCQMVSQSS